MRLVSITEAKFALSDPHPLQNLGLVSLGVARSKFLGDQICCPRSTFYKQWPISHNIGIGDKQKSQVLYLHYVRSVIDYYNKRSLTVNLCMLDLSKAFDKV